MVRSFVPTFLALAVGLGAAPRVLQAPEPAELPWDLRVATARADLARHPDADLLAALESSDPARVFAVLAMAHEGEARVAPELLAEVLSNTSNRAVARAATFLLSERGGAAATEALVQHVAARGPADDTAVELLLLADSRAGRDAMMRRAEDASADDRASLLALRAVALQPGHDATTLLRGLLDDWSSEVREAAGEALTLRQRAGLPTRTP